MDGAAVQLRGVLPREIEARAYRRREGGVLCAVQRVPPRRGCAGKRVGHARKGVREPARDQVAGGVGHVRGPKNFAEVVLDLHENVRVRHALHREGRVAEAEAREDGGAKQGAHVDEEAEAAARVAPHCAVELEELRRVVLHPSEAVVLEEDLVAEADLEALDGGRHGGRQRGGKGDRASFQDAKGGRDDAKVGAVGGAGGAVHEELHPARVAVGDGGHIDAVDDADGLVRDDAAENGVVAAVQEHIASAELLVIVEEIGAQALNTRTVLELEVCGDAVHDGLVGKVRGTIVCRLESCAEGHIVRIAVLVRVAQRFCAREPRSVV